jgi:hypothetical protein
MTLNDILHGAQGGQAVANLGAQFGLAPEAAEAAVQAMIPAFSAGLTSMAANPAAIGSVLNELASGAHAASYADPSQTAGASGLGGSVLGQLFSSEQIDAIIQHVAQVSGVSADTIRAMLPAVASMLIGGLAHAMAGQGLSGVLGQLANAAAAPGGLDPAVAPAVGSGGGVIGSLIGSMFGGGHATANPETAAMAGGLATLSAMFVSGVQVAQAHQAAMGAIAQSFTQPPPGTGV